MKPRSYDWWVTKLTEMTSANDIIRRQAIHEVADMFGADDERRRKQKPADIPIPFHADDTRRKP